MDWLSATMLLNRPASIATSRPLGVAPNALAAPADDCPNQKVARVLVPVRDDAADDGVVIGISRRIDLAVEQADDESLEDHVDRVARLEDHKRVARNRRTLLVVAEPVDAPGNAGDVRRGLGEVGRQGSTRSGLTLHEASEHVDELLRHILAVLDPHDLGRLRAVRELQAELVRVHLMHRRRWRRLFFLDRDSGSCRRAARCLLRCGRPIRMLAAAPQRCPVPVR